jgi:hypothetical protein
LDLVFGNGSFSMLHYLAGVVLGRVVSKILWRVVGIWNGSAGVAEREILVTLPGSPGYASQKTAGIEDA